MYQVGRVARAGPRRETRAPCAFTALVLVVIAAVPHLPYTARCSCTPLSLTVTLTGTDWT